MTRRLRAEWAARNARARRLDLLLAVLWDALALIMLCVAIYGGFLIAGVMQ